MPEAKRQRRLFQVEIAVTVQGAELDERELILQVEVEAYTPMAAATRLESALQRIVDEGVGRG